MIGIKDVAPFLTDKKIGLRELIEHSFMQEEELDYFNAAGIDSIHIADEFTAYELAREATVKLLQQNRLSGADIDLIIYIQNRLPEYFMSSSAARLQSDIKALKASTFSLSDLGCTDMSMAIKVAHDFLIANQQAENVIISYGNKPYSPSRFRFPVTINGDGGISLLISRTLDNVIIDSGFATDGKYWDLFQVDYVDKNQSDYKEECSSLRRYGFELAIESKIRFLELNESILKRNSLVKEDIAHYLLQNISLRAYEFYETAFDIAFSKVCHHNLAKYGHLGPADIILNYFTGLQKGIFKKGHKVLIMNNSPVASWSTILIQV